MTLNELLEIVLPRYGVDAPAGKFLDAASAVQDVIANRLWLASSDLLRTLITGTVMAGKNKYSLPSGTLGLAEEPWATNAEIAPGRQLQQLDPSRRYSFSVNGHPEFFEQRGLQFIVYPTALINTTLKMEVFKRPDPFCDLDADLPWDGMFDQVFIEATPRFNMSGAMITVTPEMDAFITQRVDLLIDHRPAKSITWLYPA